MRLHHVVSNSCDKKKAFDSQISQVGGVSLKEVYH